MIEHGIAGSVIVEKRTVLTLWSSALRANPRREALLGSTSEHVVQNCPKPVLVVK